MNSERLREILELNNFRKMQQALQAEGFADATAAFAAFDAQK